MLKEGGEAGSFYCFVQLFNSRDVTKVIITRILSG